MEQLKIFSGSANVGLANAIAKYLGTKVSSAKVGKFPDGNKTFNFSLFDIRILNIILLRGDQSANYDKCERNGYICK